MRMRLYISWSSWLGARAAALVDAAVRDAYGEHASCFFSREIKDGVDWFRMNEHELGEASAAVVLLCTDGLDSHWQAYEVGCLRGRGVPCVLLLLDLATNELGPTAYAYLNCASLTDEVLCKVIKAGFDADGAQQDQLGHLSEQDASVLLGFRLRSLLDAFKHLRQYKNITGRSAAAHEMRHRHMQMVVRGFCSAQLSEAEIDEKLTAERVPGAAYATLFDNSPCRALPRLEPAD